MRVKHGVSNFGILLPICSQVDCRLLLFLDYGQSVSFHGKVPTSTGADVVLNFKWVDDLSALKISRTRPR